MLACIDKITAVRMHKLIEFYWCQRVKEVEKQIKYADDEQQSAFLERQKKWLKETIRAVVISEEQGEVKQFEKRGLDILPHRDIIKNGFETPDGKRVELDTAFKDENHPFRVAVVCAMWLTGFDVPSLSTLYLDKPLKAHTLMQAIARANRVKEGKNNGLIVDYCGILKSLRKALATFAIESGGGKTGPGGTDPVKPQEELIAELAEAIGMVKAFLQERAFRLSEIISKTGFERIATVSRARETINKSEETRKRFEILAREIFKKFKACLTIPEINDYKDDYDAIDIIYKKLQDDKKKADITDIIR
ncbi:MAG: type I restriction enzyme endonuclease domain-containing protein, partial [Lentisphaerota bacterium]